MLDTTLGTKMNIAKDSNFHLTIPEMPLFSMFVQDVELPAITLGIAYQPTPLVEIKHPGDKIIYDDLIVTFLVDENLQNYKEVHKWLVHLGYPRSTTQYKKMAEMNSPYVRKQEMNLAIMTNKMVFASRVVFVGAFPISLTALQFSTKTGEPTNLSATCTFAYDYYYFDLDETL